MHLREAQFLMDSAKIAFVHEIANTWILLAAQKEELEILKRSLDSQQKSIDFYEKKVRVGEEDNVTFITTECR